MRVAFTAHLYKLLIPIWAAGTVFIILSITSLTFEKIIELLFAMILISMVGGLLIYFAYLIYDKYENGVLNRIMMRFNGLKTSESIVRFNYQNIEVICELSLNSRRMQNEFNFHVPRKYIQKRHRKNVEFMKPSNVSGEECFQIQSWLYITKRRLRFLESQLDSIVNINN